MSNSISQLKTLERKRQTLLDTMLEMAPIIPGSYNEVYRKCGKPNCWCQSEGNGHPLKRISWKEKGISHSKAIADQDIEWILLASKNYRHYRLAYSELQDIQGQIEEMLQKIEWEKIEASRKERKWT